MLDKLKERAWHEFVEMKQARIGLAIVALATFSSGFWAGAQFYERELGNKQSEIDLLMRQKEDAERASMPSTAPTQSDADDLIQEWSGGTLDLCQITVNGSSRLKQYRGEFNAVMLCGLRVPRRDRLNDEAVSVSTVQSIDERFQLFAPVSEPMKALIESVEANTPRPNVPTGTKLAISIGLWYEVALLPKSSDLRLLRTLSDVERLGGRLFTDEGRGTVIQKAVK